MSPAQPGATISEAPDVITGQGRILGTIAYMSPDQAEGSRGRAIGCLLTRCHALRRDAARQVAPRRAHCLLGPRRRQRAARPVDDRRGWRRSGAPDPRSSGGLVARCRGTAGSSTYVVPSIHGWRSCSTTCGRRHRQAIARHRRTQKVAAQPLRRFEGTTPNAYRQLPRPNPWRLTGLRPGTAATSRREGWPRDAPATRPSTRAGRSPARRRRG